MAATTAAAATATAAAAVPPSLNVAIQDVGPTASIHHAHLRFGLHPGRTLRVSLHRYVDDAPSVAARAYAYRQIVCNNSNNKGQGQDREQVAGRFGVLNGKTILSLTHLAVSANLALFRHLSGGGGGGGGRALAAELALCASGTTHAGNALKEVAFGAEGTRIEAGVGKDIGTETGTGIEATEGIASAATLTTKAKRVREEERETKAEASTLALESKVAEKRDEAKVEDDDENDNDNDDKDVNEKMSKSKRRRETQRNDVLAFAFDVVSDSDYVEFLSSVGLPTTTVRNDCINNGDDGLNTQMVVESKREGSNEEESEVGESGNNEDMDAYFARNRSVIEMNEIMTLYRLTREEIKLAALGVGGSSGGIDNGSVCSSTSSAAVSVALEKAVLTRVASKFFV